MNSKVFKTKNGAKKYANKLKVTGHFNIQIWEIPKRDKLTVYVVLWEK